jgi:glucose/arabinose dehydrogenase
MTTAEGWSCGDFPCEDDIDGWLERIGVPPGFGVSHVGDFPGQVRQIAYGPDERLYATVLEEGTLAGAVYVANADGSTERYSPTMNQPIGLAFQPGTDVLYVAARHQSGESGVLWRVESDGKMDAVIDDLPCCFQEMGSQPNGLVFGPDGYLYMGIGAVTDHAESSDPASRPNDEIGPLEASVLRIQPHTGDIERYAAGLRNPFDLTFTVDGQFYATDQGLVTGPGDRILRIDEGANYGWPYYRARGCADCPPTRGRLDISPDLLMLPDFTLPSGIVAYYGDQFPAVMQDTLLVALWNGTEWAQRVVWIDPNDPALGSEDYVLKPFVTGLVRPIDLAVAPDGSVVVVDFAYGHVWRISYGDVISTAVETPQFSFETPEAASATETPRSLFVTSTPNN